MDNDGTVYDFNVSFTLGIRSVEPAPSDYYPSPSEPISTNEGPDGFTRRWVNGSAWIVCWQLKHQLTTGAYVYENMYQITSIDGTLISTGSADNGCSTQIIGDPTQPCPGGNPGGSGGGGGGSGCTDEQLVIEINYGDGTGWHEIWSGDVCV